MRRYLPTLLAAFALGGCGGPSSLPHATVHYGLHGASSASSCAAQVPVGAGHMGVCAPRSKAMILAPSKNPKVTGPQILGADVSSYQGCPSFSGLRFVIFKAGEGAGYTDPTFDCHVRAAKARHIPWGVYYFQRGGDQGYQARRFYSLVHGYGSPPLSYTIDSEAGVSTSATCQFAAVLHSLTHQRVVIYTSPGLWPGGSCGALLWVADYAGGYVLPSGFSSAAAWQFTDGQYGPYPHSIGGLQGDLDQDRGLLAAFHPQPKPKPRLACFGPHANKHNRTCKARRTQVANFSRARDSSQRAYVRQGCPGLAARDAYFAGQLKRHPRTKVKQRRAALAATRRQERKHSCSVFRQRAAYFQARINHVLGE